MSYLRISHFAFRYRYGRVDVSCTALPAPSAPHPAQRKTTLEKGRLCWKRPVRRRGTLFSKLFLYKRDVSWRGLTSTGVETLTQRTRASSPSTGSLSARKTSPLGPETHLHSRAGHSLLDLQTSAHVLRRLVLALDFAFRISTPGSCYRHLSARI